MGMASLQPILTRLLKSLPPSPTQEKLNELVKQTLVEAEDKSSSENRKSQWEFLLKNAVFDLAVRRVGFVSFVPQRIVVHGG